jgi:hypothetical protein
MRENALQFMERWKNESYEKGEAQTFWNEFFEIFGVDRKFLAEFEKPIQKLSGNIGFIDLFWEGKLLIEHKSLGKDLSKAKDQAMSYFETLQEEEQPRYLLVCDFQRFELTDLKNDTEWRFELSELADNLNLFSFIAVDDEVIYDERTKLNLEAGHLMRDFRDHLLHSGYNGKDTEIFLTRQLFLLFADNIEVKEWEKNLFLKWFDEVKDPRYIGGEITKLFQILDSPKESRSKDLDELTKQFPYINGNIFKERLPISFFDWKMREKFMEILRFDWSQINPVIFGTIFQDNIDTADRREHGNHFTEEENILKVINPLFLEKYRNRFEKSRKSSKKLRELHRELANLKFLDPACGSGNFLIITYRELKRLEIEMIKEDSSIYPAISIEQFYGFELLELPSKITEVAMLLVDYQMSKEYQNTLFSDPDLNIPIKKSANIFHINSLKEDWGEVLNGQKVDYIIGNPPFYGSKLQTKEQKSELLKVFDNLKGVGNLDYITAWFIKSADYIEQNPQTETAFVSTNSIVQGEQVAILWHEIIANMGLTINFAHQTFIWSNRAKETAKVHCVVVGFGKEEWREKQIFEYPVEKVFSKRFNRLVKREGTPVKKVVKEISPYLIEGKSAFILNRNKHIQKDSLEMVIGNKPIDGGNFIFSEDEKKQFLEAEPEAEKFFREFFGAKEFLRNEKRYVLWLGEISSKELEAIPKVLERVQNVKKLRLESKSKPTQKLAETPTRFHIETIPNSRYLAIPKTSSENRRYIPIGFLEPDILVSDSMFSLSDATLYQFGVLTSSMHMAFMRYTAGRLESRYRYSIGIVYNNFPFPVKKVTKLQRENIEKLSQQILDIREEHSDSSLAKLYSPETMPEELLKAHLELDKAVDRLYTDRGRHFRSDTERVQKLFEIHRELSKDLLSDEVKPKKRKSSLKKPKVERKFEKAVQGELEF